MLHTQLTKREFCKTLAGAAAIGVACTTPLGNALANLQPEQKDKTMTFTLPPLPYAKDALEPHMSANTFSYHYDKHHQAYVNNLNNLIKDTPLAHQSLEEIITHTAGHEDKQGIFNNAAQVWNHTFFWNSMKPNGGGKPSGEIAKMIDRDLGGYDKFAEAFKKAATGQFGSGWAWLTLHDGKLKVTNTPNAYLPMIHDEKALLTIDVWEHAYYLDYQNRRPDFVTAYLDHLVNWEFAEKNLA